MTDWQFWGLVSALLIHAAVTSRPPNTDAITALFVGIICGTIAALLVTYPYISKL